MNVNIELLYQEVGELYLKERIAQRLIAELQQRIKELEAKDADG